MPIDYSEIFHENWKGSPSFPFRLFVSDEMGFFPNHWHEFMEWLYVYEGKLIVRVNEIDHTLEAGSVFFINSCDIHSFHRYKGENSRILLVHVALPLLERLIEEEKLAGGAESLFGDKICFTQEDEGHQELVSCFESLYGNSKSESVGKIVEYKIHLLRILQFLISRNPDRINRLPESGSRKRLFDCIAFVKKYYKSQISLEKAASALCLSPYHFSRDFKKMAGQTFFEYLKLYRISRARYWLANSDRPVLDIALDCGYSSIKTFNRHFLQVEKQSPSLFRKQIKKRNI